MKNTFFALIFIFPIFSVYSSGINIPVTVHGRVQASPCEVNEGKKITVDFGDLYLSDNNKFPEKTIALNFSCFSYSGKPYVRVEGQGMDNLLETNIENFKIALYQGSNTSSPLMINKNDYYNGVAIGSQVTSGIEHNRFQFTAMPILNGDVNEESLGYFHASATISIIYI